MKLLPSHQVATEKEFEQLGKDGWELTATYSTKCGNHLYSVAIFKKNFRKTIQFKTEEQESHQKGESTEEVTQP